MRLIASTAARHGVTCRLVDAAAIHDVTEEAVGGRLTFRWLLDRASDESAAFVPLARWVDGRPGPDPRGPYAINPHRRQLRATDKATMHLELMSAGVHVPHSIILPPFALEPNAAPNAEAITQIGSPFVVKPANTTGGGNGVLTGVADIATITSARATHPQDKYLVQETIRPAYVGDFRGWFRSFYVCGRVHLCWWDDRTHVYDPVEPEDERFFGLGILRSTTASIAEACGLRFFSTELVLTAEEKVVAVDYVNEMCDLRLQSVTRNGVPDAVVGAMMEDLVAFAGTRSAWQGVIP
jgi:hypothetical protein